MSGSVIIWCLYQHTKCSRRVAKKIKNKFLRGVLTIFVLFFCLFVVVFFGDLGGVALKLEKANFFHFFLSSNPCLSPSILAVRCNRRLETVLMPI